MAEIFVSYAQKDRDAALPMIEAIRRANLSVWHQGMMTPGEDWDEKIAHKLKTAKCTIFVWSKAAAQSELLQREIHYAMQAWSYDRLVLATLDDAPLPVGLRDLSPISIRDASGTKQLIERVRSIISVQATAAPAEAPARPTRVRRLSPFLAPLVVATLFAGWVLAGAWFVYESMLLLPQWMEAPVTPPPTPETAMGLSTLAALAFSLVLILGAAIGAGAVWVWHSRSQRSSNRAQALAASIGWPQVFVSYSRQDARTVERLVQQIEQLGYAVWIDRRSTGSQRYAAPIVRAIRTSRLVALMCSQNAFVSDHVTREVYVAGDCKKPFIVFQLNSTEFPDELLYFVSGFPRVSVTNVDPEQLRSQIAKLIAA